MRERERERDTYLSVFELSKGIKNLYHQSNLRLRIAGRKVECVVNKFL